MPTPNAPVSAFPTNQELWYWNGFQLNQPYWNIATFGGSRFGVPTLRGSNIEVPYRAGQYYRGSKFPDSRTVTLVMWTDGSQSANQSYPAADSRRAFNDNWQALRAAFFTRGAGVHLQGVLERNWYWTMGGSPQLVESQTMAEIAGSMDPTMNSRFQAAFSVDLLLNDPYFYGNLRTQNVTSSGGTITANGEGVVGEGWSSTVNSFTIVLSAATTVTNTTAGVSFTVASGPAFPVTVDVLNYTVTDNNGANQIAKITHQGGRQWMYLLSGANVITNTAGTATFSWHDAFI